MIQVLLWLPLAVGLVCLVLPKRAVPVAAVLGSAGALVLAAIIAIGFDPDVSGLQHAVDESWIPDLGVRYQLGIDGISVFLVVLTTLVWTGSVVWSAFDDPDRPRTYFLMLLLAETATLGAFIAQDLLLFVLFFDLMLIPFFFLFGSWGAENEGVKPVPATMKMMVYTLVGSLLMLVGAIAAAILATPEGGQISFSISTLSQNLLPAGSQDWIFWFFAAAFLVKMPAFLLHGWMPDAYRVAPLPVLVVFSAVLSKVGAYGFLRVSLPLFPDAADRFQEVVLIIALASILYGSVMAFTQTNLRLIAGFSSVAQLGFITLGIFSLRPDGADGAVLQMVNHGLVVAPLFFIVAILYRRAGTEDLREMGGLAMRAPVLAALFLIVTLATLAMPGSSNFIGEFFIVNGVFQDKIVYGVIATIGIVLASFYALRLYQRTMHNRKPEELASREITLREALVVVPLVACIIAIALWPGLIVEHGEASVEAALSCSEVEGTYSNQTAGAGDETSVSQSCETTVASAE